MRRKEREQKVPGPEENAWYIQICCLQERERGHEETQPWFRSVLNMVHGPVLTVEERELVPIAGKWDEPSIISP